MFCKNKEPSPIAPRPYLDRYRRPRILFLSVPSYYLADHIESGKPHSSDLSEILPQQIIHCVTKANPFISPRRTRPRYFVVSSRRRLTAPNPPTSPTWIYRSPTAKHLSLRPKWPSQMPSQLRTMSELALRPMRLHWTLGTASAPCAMPASALKNILSELTASCVPPATNLCLPTSRCYRT